MNEKEYNEISKWAIHNRGLRSVHRDLTAEEKEILREQNFEKVRKRQLKMSNSAKKGAETRRRNNERRGI